jgi:hypothetical protein
VGEEEYDKKQRLEFVHLFNMKYDYIHYYDNGKSLLSASKMGSIVMCYIPRELVILGFQYCFVGFYLTEPELVVSGEVIWVI